MNLEDGTISMYMPLNIVNSSGYPFEKATPGAIGFDLRAVLGHDDNHRYIRPGSRSKFDTGIKLELPAGVGALVQPRSGMGLHHGVVALTGVIDQDYRGFIGVVLINHGTDSYKVRPGDRIAQLVLISIPTNIIRVNEVPELGLTDRGGSGFGSTGR